MGRPVARKFFGGSRPCAIQAGTRIWSFHAHRHFFVTALLNGGASAEAVRVLAGHSKLEMTQRYAHAIGADLEVAMSRLHGKPHDPKGAP